MEQASKYRTIESISEGFYKEKGSKFFAFAIPCKTELDAKIVINDLRKKHHQAVHVCSAFRFGSDKKLARSSGLKLTKKSPLLADLRFIVSLTFFLSLLDKHGTVCQFLISS